HPTLIYTPFAYTTLFRSFGKNTGRSIKKAMNTANFAIIIIIGVKRAKSVCIWSIRLAISSLWILQDRNFISRIGPLVNEKLVKFLSVFLAVASCVILKQFPRKRKPIGWP